MRTHLLLQTLIHATLISIVSAALGSSAQAQGLPSYMAMLGPGPASVR